MLFDFASATLAFALFVVCVALFYLWLKAESKYRKSKQ
jgi:amino acid transporter